jgi:hypothetical protein
MAKRNGSVRHVPVWALSSFLALVGFGCQEPDPGPVIEPPDTGVFSGLGGNWMDDSYEGGAFTIWVDYEVESASAAPTTAQEGVTLEYVSMWSADAVCNLMDLEWSATNCPNTDVEKLSDGAFYIKARVADSGVRVKSLRVTDSDGVPREVTVGGCVEVKKHWLDLSGLKVCR